MRSMCSRRCRPRSSQAPGFSWLASARYNFPHGTRRDWRPTPRWSCCRAVGSSGVDAVPSSGLEGGRPEALAAYVTGGGGLLLAVSPDIDGDVVGDVLGAEARLRIAVGNARPEDRALAPSDARHPIFRSLGGGAATLGLVTFHTVARIDGSGCQTVARFTTAEAALLECMPGDGRALVLASDLGNIWNDFPLHATFVPFLHEEMQYLAGGRVQSDYL